MASLFAVNPPSKTGALKPPKDFYMIIFADLNLKKILKLKKNLNGHVQKFVQSVKLIKCGGMVLYW